jgi:DNA-binding NtrC family response regulator
MDAQEGYALWNTSGSLIDANPSFHRLTGQATEPENQTEEQLELVPPKQGPGPFRVPQSVFHGEVVDLVLGPVAAPSKLFRLNAWPVTDDQGEIVGALGRIEPASGTLEGEHENNRKPVWGLRLATELHKRRAQISQIGLESLVGKGPVYDRIIRQVQAAIQAKCHVIIAGEPGSGRHQTARVIHAGWQQNREKRSGLVPLDPSSLPAEILARDFLGVGPGKRPVWNVPSGSTILIEELEGLDSILQQAIMEATGNVQIIGLIKSRKGLESLKKDFLAYIDILTVETVPVRNRIDEIPMLAQSVLERLNTSSAKSVDGFTAQALELLQLYDWPGNWRDLEQVVREAFESTEGPWIDQAQIPSWIQGSFGGAWMQSPSATRTDRLEETMMKTQRSAIEQALAQFGENKAAVARALGISRPKLYRLLAELGFDSTTGTLQSESEEKSP